MPIQRWSSPVLGRVKGVIGGGLCAAVAIVFFQPWFGITVAAVVGVACIANLLLGAGVTLDTEAGLLGLRWGLIVRRVRLADVTAVLVEDSKLSIGRASGGEISIYLWGRGSFDRWLGMPVVAGDIGHAVARASNAARSAAEEEAPDAVTASGASASGAAATAGAGRRGSSAASRSALATMLLGCLGLLSVGAALLVRHSWHNPAMSVIAVILALLLGIGGVFYVCLSAALFASSARVGRRSLADAEYCKSRSLS
ncbi:hypothetical protein EAS64_39925 [Trebonia kvetii]|uniref:PH domain-containing protein n=1 Tax=Trebonia kvetii TaxID=2480626 RepID=A0A6P2BLC3_9ACTN|nr:hypothetical protein [Trebonia kvetii]TVY99823.1 hypothetical protein EAS64_39925 [Trebonia kvetii]